MSSAAVVPRCIEGVGICNALSRLGRLTSWEQGRCVYCLFRARPVIRIGVGNNCVFLELGDPPKQAAQ